MSNPRPSRDWASESATLHLAVRQACGYISTHLAEDLKLKRVARLVGRNASYFSELFHLETGLHFSVYVEFARIEQAKDLLVSTRMPITTIAEAVGYRDVGTLERAFKRHEAVSPRMFRTLHGGANARERSFASDSSIEKSLQTRGDAENPKKR